MRIQLILIVLLSSFSAWSVNDKSMGELFQKYDQLMTQKKVELVDEVFTKKFLRETGGKEAFIKKLRKLPARKKSAKKDKKLRWKKGVKNEIYFVKNQSNPNSEFIVIEEDGKLKIDGQVSDAE